jgi:ATP-binding protein involved in chromosome partitioning
VVISEPDGEHARIYRDIAARAWEGVKRERAAPGRQPPKIVIED